jgi:hypothetical protein
MPFHGIENRVNALHAHHEDRLQVLESTAMSPRSAADLLPTLFARDLDTHQTMFAMGEAIAHLNRLEHAGRLLRSETAAMAVIRFVRRRRQQTNGEAETASRSASRHPVAVGWRTPAAPRACHRVVGRRALGVE